MARPAPTPLGSDLLVSKGNQSIVAPTPLPEEEPQSAPAPPRPSITIPAATGQPVQPARSALAPKARVVRVPLTVKITPETLKRLRVVAVHAEIEQQDIVEEALRNWLDINEV